MTTSSCRRFGSFRRVIPLPSDVDVEGVKRQLKSGALTATAPRTGKADESRRSIPIQTG
jgi:HSP20 family molecular chaperone IbpA